MLSKLIYINKSFIILNLIHLFLCIKRFTIVRISRYSAHHWHHVSQAMLEMYRVLRPDGKVVIVDVLGNSHGVLNNFLQTIEILRDTSHVKDYSLSEWLYFAETVGFRVETVEKQRLTLNLTIWTARMNTPSENCQVIQALQTMASDEIKHYFDLQSDGTFSTNVGYLVLTK